MTLSIAYSFPDSQDRIKGHRAPGDVTIATRTIPDHGNPFKELSSGFVDFYASSQNGTPSALKLMKPEAAISVGHFVRLWSNERAPVRVNRSVLRSIDV